MSARDVTDATFAAEVLQNAKPVIVDFWAPWCGPCRAVSPILDAIAEDHADKIDIVKLNVDEFPDLAVEYNILNIPAMKVFKGGEVVKTVVGAKPRPALEQDRAEFLDLASRSHAERLATSILRSQHPVDESFNRRLRRRAHPRFD